MKQAAIESTLAFEELKKFLLKDGDVCPYEALKAVIDKDPQGDGYSYVVTARNRFQREFDCVLGPIPNVGIKRSTLRDVVNVGISDIARSRRHNRKALWRQSTIADPEKQAKLSAEERSTYLSNFSQLGVLNHLMKPSSVKKIKQASDTAMRALPSSEALELFRGKKDSSGPVN